MRKDSGIKIPRLAFLTFNILPHSLFGDKIPEALTAFVFEIEIK